MSRLRQTALSFGRFGIVGLSGIVLNLVVLQALISFGVQHLLASLLATEVAIVNNFTWNNRWTFKQEGSLSKFSTLTRFIRFLMVSNLTGLLTLGLFAVFTGLGGWHYLLAQFVAIGFSTVVNFVAISQFIWKKTRNAIETPLSNLVSGKGLDEYARDFGLKE